MAVPAKRRAGVLCFRPASQDSGYEFLLISRRSKQNKEPAGLGKERGDGESPVNSDDDRFTIPAGKFEAEADSSIEDCARREVMEEAGVECELVQDLGWHDSRSKKRNEPIETCFFLGRCVRLLESWQEATSRERSWFTPADALQKVSYRQDLSSVISLAIQALSSLSPQAVNGGYARARSRTTPEIPTLEEQSCIRATRQYMTWTPPGNVQEHKEDSGKHESAERYMKYSHQVGGHFCMVKPMPGTRLEVEMPMKPQMTDRLLQDARSGENCIVQGSKVILKPFDAAEARFYCQLPEVASLLPFAPLFYGTKKLRTEQIEILAFDGDDTGLPPERKRINSDDQTVSHRTRRYIVLEDLGSVAQQPCFLDLKVGCRQRAARHNAQKRAHMAAKAARSTSAALGFRICGMQSYDAETGTIQRYDKYWGQQISQESMYKTLATFFSRGCRSEHAQPGIHGVSRILAEAVVEELGKLEATLRQLRGKRFWGSSLLIFFDAALAHESKRDEFLKSVQLKMIDFANFEEVGGEEPDEEYLCGVSNIRSYLQTMLDGGSAAPKLIPPPPPAKQDQEQQKAWEALQAGRSPKNSQLRARTKSNSSRAGGKEEDVNVTTVSGATGRTLLRELATSRLLSPDGERYVRNDTVDSDGDSTQGRLENLFDR